MGPGRPGDVVREGVLAQNGPPEQDRWSTICGVVCCIERPRREPQNDERALLACGLLKNVYYCARCSF